MTTTKRTDATIRSLARRIWRGMEQGAEALARGVQEPTPDWENPFDPDHVASQMFGLNFLAVGDHARSMGALLLSPKLGPSSATIARGAVESLARIRWICVGETQESVRVRALTVLHADVAKTAFSQQYLGDDGLLDRRAYLDRVDEAITKLAQPRPNWAVGTAIREAAGDAWGDAGLDDRIPYSMLSSMAHGTMPALSSLAHGDRLHLTRQEIVNHAAFVLGIADRTVRALLRCPLAFMPISTVERVWVPIIKRIEPLRLQLAEEDLEDPLLASGP